MDKIISPTVGRIVLFWPAYAAGDSAPHAAIITKVFNDRLINVAVFDPDGGGNGAAHGVPLLQEGDATLFGPDGASKAHCQWMPYQKGQAAKTDDLAPRVAELERQIASLLSIGGSAQPMSMSGGGGAAMSQAGGSAGGGGGRSRS